MSTAIVLIGQMRTYMDPKIVNSYRKYLTSDPIIDMYVFTWNKIGHSHRHGKYNIHPNMNHLVCSNTISEYYTQFDFIRVKHVCVDDFDEFVAKLDPERSQLYHTPFNGHGMVSTCVPVEYKYQQASRYLSSIPDIETQYAHIVITRPDACFVDSLPTLSTSEGFVYWNCRCVRCMDHVWYGKPNTIIKQLYRIFDDILVHNNTLSIGKKVTITSCFISRAR